MRPLSVFFKGRQIIVAFKIKEEKRMKKAVITVIGKDKVGIIHNISGILSESNINILDISQTIMGDIFTMVMMTDISNSGLDFSLLSEKLEKSGNEMGVKVTICLEDIFNEMHRI